MAKDFAALSENTFPVRQIAEFVCNRMAWQDDPRECCTFIEHTRFKGQSMTCKEAELYMHFYFSDYSLKNYRKLLVVDIPE